MGALPQGSFGGEEAIARRPLELPPQVSLLTQLGRSGCQHWLPDLGTNGVLLRTSVGWHWAVVLD